MILFPVSQKDKRSDAFVVLVLFFMSCVCVEYACSFSKEEKNETINATWSYISCFRNSLKFFVSNQMKKQR